MKTLTHLDSETSHSSAGPGGTLLPSNRRLIKTVLSGRGLWIVIAALFLRLSASAFPPAPHHLIYGTVRDEMGNPLWLEGAAVILESPSGVAIKAEVIAGLEPGVNYKIAVPLDAGVTSDAYRTSALRAAMPFKLRVQIRKTFYMPIEMSGDFASLGQPAGSTRLDLTLGEDSNRNGLPDAWERAIIAASGGGLDEINPGDDSDNDGLSNLEEYQAGTFAFDVNDGFSLRIVEMKSEVFTMEFMTIRGRTYSVFASSDMSAWETVPFLIAGEDADAKPRLAYQAVDSKVVKVSVTPSPGAPAWKFFKLRAD